MKNKKIVISLIIISIIGAGITISVIGKQHPNNIPNARTVYIGGYGPSCISGTVSDVLVLEYSIALYSRAVFNENHSKKLYIDGRFHSNSKAISNTICYEESDICLSIQGVSRHNFKLDTTTLENGLHELKILNNDGSIFTSVLVFVQN
jgi:hypothetical protein